MLPGPSARANHVADFACEVYRTARSLHAVGSMRTSLNIDDDLLADAMAATGLATKKATVEEALRMLVRRRRRLDAVVDMAGLGWDGDLAAMREERSQPNSPTPPVAEGPKT